MKSIESNMAPAPIGPYSQAVEHNGMIFVSGQIPLNHQGELVTDIKLATKQSMDNLVAILSSAQLTFANVVKVSIFTTDIKQFGVINEVYAEYFKNIQICPAREVVEVAALPKGAVIEISLIAMR